MPLLKIPACAENYSNHRRNKLKNFSFSIRRLLLLATAGLGSLNASAFQVCNQSLERVFVAYAQSWQCGTDGFFGDPVGCQNVQGWQQIEIGQCHQYPGNNAGAIYAQGANGSVWQGTGNPPVRYCVTNNAFSFDAKNGSGPAVTATECQAAGGQLKSFLRVTTPTFTLNAGVFVPTPQPQTPTQPPATAPTLLRPIALAWSQNGVWQTRVAADPTSAQNAAVQACQAASSGQPCTIATTLGTDTYTCIAILRDSNNNNNMAYGTGSSTEAATNSGLGVCQTSGYACKLEYTVCNDYH